MLLVRGFLVSGLVAGAALISLTAAADPGPGDVNATTYLHDGPGRQYRVVDELATGTHVRILMCDEDWCRVQSGEAVGYLPRASLAQQAPLSAAKPDGKACVEATEAGEGAGLRYSYCPRS